MSVLASLIDERSRWARQQVSCHVRRAKARALSNYLFLTALAVAVYVFRERIQAVLFSLAS